MEKMKLKKIEDILVIIGGVIPPQDIPLMKKMGVKEVFPVGSSFAEIVKFINENVAK
jgi:methylmalonyl-CoA mutase C-terminal domain/subunit